ncbi:hypothetical protein C882_2666 [Caenispirillum salinarum AK4]|uniref:Uncharacterized protein n=1 Tax=Caenispirillum salinarum AK4 TaxID=1238182 RepID=K9H4V2_9PROT|nr:hypothetical protein [Caenispirillum salinarum]EKV32587.1 hypothetical protein C882_2666 [Caenispirillum salinarum AK4]
MLTLQDCIALSDLTPEELMVIAHHEHLPDIVAVEKGYAFLQKEWGNPALRQMMLDEVSAALRDGRKQAALELLAQLRDCCEKHPGGRDRRLQHREH